MGRRRTTELTGQRFGRLVVLGRAPESPGGVGRWRCRCDCGTESTVWQSNLRSGNTQSCGCGQWRERRTRRLSAPDTP